MVYVGSSWVELDYWTSPTWGDYDARMRVLAYSTQDIASNTSRIYFKLQKRVTGGSAYNYDDRDFRITGTGASGDGHSATQTWNFGSVSDTSWVDVGGDTSDMYWSSVKHRDDGTLTLTATASGDRPLGGSFDTDISIELPRIARASSPTITPNPQTWSSTNTNSITVNTNRKSSGFTHTIRCDVWNYKVTKTGVGASTTFDIPYSTLASMPANQTEFSGSVYTQTYSGSTKIGSEVKSTWTIKVDTSIEHPNVGTITVEDTNTRTSAIVGAETFIYGISTLKATIPLTVSGSYTELASAVVTCGNRSQTYTLSGTSQTITFTFDKVDAPSLTVKVTDKRGTPVTKTKTYTLMPYQPETLTATVGRVTATGSTAVGQVSGVAYGGNYGQASNSLTVTYKYKEHDSSTWTDSPYSATLTLNEGQQTYTHAITLLEEYDYQKQYDIQFIVNDLFNTATYECRLMQGLPILSWDETEVDVWGSLHIHNREKPTVYQNVMDGFGAVLAHGAQKNLAVYDPRTVTVGGITYHIYANGGVRVTGTATAYSSCNVGAFTAVNGEEYILSGCPEGGGERTYSVGVGSVHDYGEGATVTGNGLQYIYIDVFTGETVDMTVYPMVRDARIANEEFETPLLCTRYFTSSSVSVSANSSASTNISITVPSGYRVLAILRSWTNGDILINYISTSTQSLQQGQTSVTAWVRNPKSSASNVTVSVEVLFIRA